MSGLLTQFRSFGRPSQVLMLNQFSINVGFFMLMPYLAGYLAGPLGMATWAIGLVMGARNFSQQGMFLVGGTLADRLGYKPLIIAGCLLRTGGFVLLALMGTLPAILIASVATGFAGALFNPAVRAYLAADSSERRIEAFAVFNVFYQAGILLGPLAGLALTAVDFTVTCWVAAAVFGVLTVVQIWALPANRIERAGERPSVLTDWRTVLANRPFVLFSLVMIGSYVLSFQVYLALPLQAGVIVGQADSDTLLVTSLFVVSALVAIAGQLRITAWAARRWGPSHSLVGGMTILAGAFVPLILVSEPTQFGPVAAGGALLVSAALLALGTAVMFPFEMDTVVALAGGRLVATHYGFYNTVVGVGILLGNLGTGTVFGLASDTGHPALAWIALAALGAGSMFALHRLQRSGRLPPEGPDATAPDEVEDTAGAPSDSTHAPPVVVDRRR